MNLVVLWIAWTGCESAAPDPVPVNAAAVAVRTEAVKTARYRPVTEVTGSADPVASVQLGFEVPGRLREVLVHRGDRVEVGQALGKLDMSVAAGQRDQASAGVVAAEAAASAAKDALERVRQLGEAATAQQITQLEAQVAASEAQAAQARAAAQMVLTNLGKHVLRSPIAGVVTAAPDNPGAMVGPGAPMFVVEDLSALRIKGSAPESQGWLAAGQSATIRAGTGDAEVTGLVERVLPSLDPATRRIPVEIRVDDPPEWLRAHAFVRAEIAAAQELDVYAIPRGALVARPDFAVLVMRSPTDPVRVPVTVVGEEAERTLVLGELAEGDLVAVDPPQGFGS